MKQLSNLACGLMALSLVLSPYELTARAKQEKVRLITQKDVDEAQGNLVLNHSGQYKVVCDLTGTLTLEHDNLCLDLGCHQVNGNGAPAAITATGLKDISISNGAVTNPGSLGVQISHCTGARVDNVQMYESNAALTLSDCHCSNVSNVKAYNNLNTSGAVILVDSSDSITLSSVDACNNTKALLATPPLGANDPAVGILSVFNSTNIRLEEVSANSNKQTNDTSFFGPLSLIMNLGVTVKNSQSSFNTKMVDDTNGFAPLYLTLNFGTLQGGDVVIDGFQANGNSMGSTNALFRPIYILDSPHVSVKNAQVNDNSVQKIATGADGSFLDMTGIAVFAFNVGQNDTIITDSQVTGNVVFEGANAAGESDCYGIQVIGSADVPGFENRTTITRVQANGNSVQQSSAGASFAIGLGVGSAANITISESSFDGNSAGKGVSGSIGILSLGFAFPPFINADRIINILDSTTNNNSSVDGLAIGMFLVGIGSSSKHCTIANSQASEMSGATLGHGIVLENAQGCSIVNTQTNGNSHDGVFAGMLFNTTPPTLNLDCSIINNTATNNGANGFEIATASNFLLQGNRAISNGINGFGSGFVDATNPRTNVYIANYASNNKTKDYDITKGAIALQQLNVDTGIYTAIGTGDPRLASQSNIETVPS